MRKLFAILSLIVTTILVYLLDKPMGSLPALGRLLDPVNGAIAAAEPTNTNFSKEFTFESLQQPVTVSIDERLVPHINAANDHDAYFMQGYIHAYFRLWQMDLQTRAAAGRVSEILGEKALKFDRDQRRKGMVYGAENSLKAMEADPRSKQMLDAYTEGVNNYISELEYRDYPIEYKLMGFKPEAWTNLKCALLLKYMADDLTGYTEDIALTVLRQKMKVIDATGSSDELFNFVFPERIAGTIPIIPKDTIGQMASLQAHEAPADSLACVSLDASAFEMEENEGKGSNNWALSGSKTKSGVPILCNDPHLGLNLPSLWFEIQLTAPGMNVYGASLPGSPGVVIGFNDNISWGFTNNYRDVKDFYLVKPASKNTYWFAGKELAYTKRLEKIAIKGKADFIDTIHYTIQGPVIYDEHYHGPGGLKLPVAMCWMAHRPSNEVLSLYLLNRSNNYEEYVKAIQQFLCPAQNMLYADKAGSIAIWGQGQFINKWKGQGRYVMDGSDSSTLWKENIPVSENPHALNPVQGYLASANQTVTDTTYPYWYNGYFYEFRSWRINNVLRNTQQATVQDMFALQNDVHSVLAETVLPALLQYLPPSGSLSDKEKEWLQYLGSWNDDLSADSKPATVFMVWWHFIEKKFGNVGNVPDDLHIKPERLMQMFTQGDDMFPIDRDAFYGCFKQAVDSLDKLKQTNKLQWARAKNTTINHLTKIPAFGYADLDIGGWGNVVNAVKGNHGPSWRMVVQMSKEIEAYGVYPGGQSGNPGSKYYATFLDKWVKGEYYRLHFYKADNKDTFVKYTWTIHAKS